MNDIGREKLSLQTLLEVFKKFTKNVKYTLISKTIKSFWHGSNFKNFNPLRANPTK